MTLRRACLQILLTAMGWSAVLNPAMAQPPCPLWQAGITEFSRACLLAQLAGPPAVDEDPITTVVTRTPRRVDDSPASVTVIDRKRIERSNSQTLRDVFRYEPGVSVRQSFFYDSWDINVRGIGGRRVLRLIDGIRLP
ncbi:MAG: TonB-dependent receptor plug domain-containing protein [Gloeomargarita sp. SKYG116]|nr:TonB-dependent receptor plug domain-containing protein [Gloeomargarita sp. SKYG116]MDW8400412.1 TonB-dependent receptor plug domain-containing protein [Gloeomargarita sp. SKYGB_i_bin116]